MALDITQVGELVANDGYQASFDRYDSLGLIYPRLGRVIDPESAGIPLYGEKWSVFMGHERARKREDLQDIDDSTTKKAWTAQAAISPYSRGLRIASRALRAQGNNQGVKDDIIQWMTDRAEVTGLQKEDLIAGMFQKGTLTAGDTEFFDGSFVDNPDPNRGFIYDGLPWFDTAHTRAGGSSTYANHVVSAALSQATIQNALTLMRHTNAVNDRGERIMIRPNLLVVPPGLEFSARTIMNSTQLSGSANNDVNPIAGALEVLTWSALSDAASSAAWWVGQSGRGLRIYDSGPPRYWVVQEDNGDITINSEFYFGAAPDNWRYWTAHNKAAS